MYLNNPTIKFSELDKYDLLQLFSVQYGLSEPMTSREFQKKYLDENQKTNLRFREWYDVMSKTPEEAWPDMEWLLVVREEKIHLVVP